MFGAHCLLLLIEEFKYQVAWLWFLRKSMVIANQISVFPLDCENSDNEA